MNRPVSKDLDEAYHEYNDQKRKNKKEKCTYCGFLRFMRQTGVCNTCFYDLNECEHPYLELTGVDEINTYRCVDCKTPFKSKQYLINFY